MLEVFSLLDGIYHGFSFVEHAGTVRGIHAAEWKGEGHEPCDRFLSGGTPGLADGTARHASVFVGVARPIGYPDAVPA